MALSLVVSEMFNVERYRDLEIPVKSQSRSLKGCPHSCPRVHLSEVPVVGLGQDLSEHLWGSELFAVWMTLDDPKPNTNPGTTDYEPLKVVSFDIMDMVFYYGYVCSCVLWVLPELK